MRKDDSRDHFEISFNSSESIPSPASPTPNPLTPLSPPYFTAAIILLHLLVFLYGLSLIGFENFHLSLTSPISLPNRQLIFLPIGTWPDCQNLKSQFWRLLSHQFVHAGLVHLLSNQCMTILFGFFVEISHGFWKTLLIYEFGILSGVLFHSACLPYLGLMGCSHGVYALYGASVALAFSSVPPFSTSSTYRFTVLFSIVIQILSDIFAFLFYFNPAVGYMAHIGGFITGFLLSLVCLLPSQFNQWKGWRVALSLLALIAYLVPMIVIVDRYLAAWPPQTLIPLRLYQWIVHNQNDGGCCEDMFDMINSPHTNASLAQQMERVQEQYYCDGRHLQYSPGD
jgi:membrane associated rhomboid family serine protease